MLNTSVLAIETEVGMEQRDNSTGDAENMYLLMIIKGF